MKKYKKIITTLLLCGAVAFTFSACGGGGGGGGGDDGNGNSSQPASVNSFVPTNAAYSVLRFQCDTGSYSIYFRPDHKATVFHGNIQITGSWTGTPSSFSVTATSATGASGISLTGGTLAITTTNYKDDGDPDYCDGMLSTANNGFVITYVDGGPTAHTLNGNSARLTFSY